MKKIFTLGFLAVFTAMNAQIKQDSLTQEEEVEEVLLVNPSDYKKNIIKTNVTSVFFRNFQFSYERSFTRMFSVNATYGFMPEGKVPTLERFVDQNNVNDLKLDELRIKGSTFTIEPRFYFGKGYGQGFYMAPYYRYATYSLSELPAVYSIKQAGVSYDVPLYISGDTRSHNFGLVLGAQWILGEQKNWVIDWWFAGAHYGVAKGDLHGKTNRDLTPEEQKQIREEIKGYDLPVVDYTYEVNAKGVDFHLDGPWAGVRFGVGVGYRF